MTSEAETRMGEARVQARFTAATQMDRGRCFIVEQPAASTMWRTRAMRRAVAHAHTVVAARR